MTSIARSSRKAASAAFLLLLLLGVTSTEAKAANKKHNEALEADKRKLFRDDENFWSRFVQEVTSSSFPQPELELTKTVAMVDGACGSDDVDALTINNVEAPVDVLYCYVVENTGSDPLFDLELVDDNGTPGDKSDDFDVTCPKTTLAAGESITCSAVVSVDAGTTVNIATVTGNNGVPGSPTLTDTDTAKVTLNLLNPELVLVKTVATTEGSCGTDDVDVLTVESVEPSVEVLYCYVVENPGDATVFDLELVDDNGTPGDRSDDFDVTCPSTTLEAGASITCSAVVSVDTGTTVNTATVTGNTGVPGSPPLTDTDTATVTLNPLNPELVLVKTVATIDGSCGTNDVDSLMIESDTFPVDVLYCYVVENPGDATVFDLQLVDDNGTPNDDSDDIVVTCPSTTLEAGTSITCSAIVSVNGGTTVNIGTVTGNNGVPGSPPLTATDTATVTLTIFCETEAEISCVAEDGTPCDQLQRPEGTCSIGSDIDTLKFVLEFCSCEESRNTQPGFADSCEDSGALTGDSVRVTCANPSGSPLFSETISEGDEIVMDGGIPESITCSVFSLSGNLLQQVVIDTSGTVDLYLKDKFGSFSLEACDDQDCLTDVTYTYTIFNTGPVPVTVTTFERELNGETMDLLPDLVPQEVAPETTASASETEQVDICMDGDYSASVEVVAVPADGGPECPAQDEYEWSIEVGCRVDVEITCKAEDGTECEDLKPSTASCTLAGEPMTEIKFRYVDCTCDESSNSQEGTMCTDSAPFPSGPVSVQCVDAESMSSLSVSPGTVSPGETLVITNSGGVIPNEVMCTISDGSTTIQEFSFFTGEGNSLSLKDKFGSFELEACEDDAGNTLDCEVLVCYTYDLENVGTSDMDITLLERTRDGETESLFGLLDVTNLRPGDSTSVDEKDLVDICIEEEYTTTVRVEADPPSGITCFDEDTYTFSTEPGCNVDIEILCKAEDGTECQDLVPPTGSCSLSGEPLTELKFTYRDCTCDEEFNSQAESSCADSSPFPGGPVSVSCVPAGGGGQLSVTPGTLVSGDTVVVTAPGGGPLPAEVVCTVSDGSTVVQEFSFFTIGSQLSLKDKFGSFELESCEDESGNSLDCEVLLCYTYEIENVGESPMDLTGLERERDGETDSLLDLLDVTNLDVGQTTSVEEKDLVNICVDGTFTTEVSVNGDPPNGITCYDEDIYEFDINVAPTPGPTPPPTPEPTPGPSPEPTPEPTPFPTPEPTPEPTPGPTPPPTPEPTPGPSPEPTPEPTPNPTPPPIPDPTPEPTPGPTPPPTPEPTPGPTPPPTPGPTLPPTPPPTPGPTPPPTPGPTVLPTPFPTLPPTNPPSAAPTEECVFDLNIECIPLDGSSSCNATPPPVEQCEGRPFEMVFLFNGGDCAQSFNVQDDGKFFCTDFNSAPPTQRGEKAYIVVTALKDDILYHQDWVEVGELFTLSDGGERFVADQLITIYSSDDTSNPANLLQSVQYHSSCSQNLFLKDRFGAVQLVIWINEVQGVVSCFANQTFTMDISVPIDLEGGPFTIQTLTVASNVEPFFFNLTDKVNGLTVNTGDTIETTLSIPIDLTEKKTYNLLITLTATTATGQICRGTELLSFTAGYPIPPIFPTFSPTQAPSGLA